MSTSYKAAKRIALGLELDRPASAGDDLWNISLDAGAAGGFGIAAEMPFQSFERSFEPPDEQTAQKAALMLYDEEYAADRKAVGKNLQALEQALSASDEARLRRLLADAPLAQWLSLVFLEGDRLRDGLVPRLEKASSACRAVFSEAADQALRQLVNFRDLLETLKQCC